MSQFMPVRSGQLRIGDAERDQAVAELSEHFVAGRLTQDEFEDRSGLATKARYADDLAPLFADLPDPAAAVPQPAWSFPQTRPRQRPPFLWLAPLFIIGLVVAAVVFTAPWFLWAFFWIALFAGPHHHRHHHNHHGRRLSR